MPHAKVTHHWEYNRLSQSRWVGMYPALPRHFPVTLPPSRVVIYLNAGQVMYILEYMLYFCGVTHFAAFTDQQVSSCENLDWTGRACGL